MDLDASDNWTQNWRRYHLRELDHWEGVVRRPVRFATLEEATSIGRRGWHQRRALRIANKHRAGHRVPIGRKTRPASERGTLS